MLTTTISTSCRDLWKIKLLLLLLLRISSKDRFIEEVVNTKFFGLQVDKHLNWQNHIEQMIPKLRAACYAVMSAVCNSNINTLQSVYCEHFNSVVKNGIILWGNSSNRGKMFTL